MPPFARVSDWGAFWRNDVIGWEGYWIFIFLTQVYIGIAALIWFIRWFRTNEMDYWKEWLCFVVLVFAVMRFAPWNHESYGVANYGGDNMQNILVNEGFAKMERQMGFTWADAKTKTNDARLQWVSIRMSWRQAGTQIEAILWKTAWGFIYLWVMAIPTVVILAGFGND